MHLLDFLIVIIFLFKNSTLLRGLGEGGGEGWVMERWREGEAVVAFHESLYCLFADSCGFVCTEIYAPVCGTDGETYGNKCSMEREACQQKKEITVAYDGECVSE